MLASVARHSVFKLTSGSDHPLIDGKRRLENEEGWGFFAIAPVSARGDQNALAKPIRRRLTGHTPATATAEN